MGELATPREHQRPGRGCVVRLADERLGALAASGLAVAFSRALNAMAPNRGASRTSPTKRNPRRASVGRVRRAEDEGLAEIVRPRPAEPGPGCDRERN